MQTDPAAARVVPARRDPTATPPIAAQTPGRNHRPRKKPRRSDPTSSPPSLSDGRLPQKAFQAQSLSRTKTPYPGYIQQEAIDLTNIAVFIERAGDFLTARYEPWPL